METRRALKLSFKMMVVDILLPYFHVWVNHNPLTIRKNLERENTKAWG